MCKGGHGQFPGRRNSISSEHVTLNELKKSQFNYKIEFRRAMLEEAWQVDMDLLKN